eukprot:6351122-Lingulodinium_polyedra.AAC.1
MARSVGRVWRRASPWQPTGQERGNAGLFGTRRRLSQSVCGVRAVSHYGQPRCAGEVARDCGRGASE